MILSGQLIKNALVENFWQCNKDVSELNIGSNSVDVTVSGHYAIPKPLPAGEILDLEKADSTDLFEEIYEEEFVLYPGQPVLGSVNEAFNCDMPLIIEGQEHRFIPQYDGRSTIARVFIQSHMTAGFGDHGFKGSFTLEILNCSPWPIYLRKDMRIGQVYFDTMLGKADLYDGYDQTDCKPQLPRLGPGRFYVNKTS